VLQSFKLDFLSS